METPAPDVDAEEDDVDAALAKVVAPSEQADNPYWAAAPKEDFGRKLDARLELCRQALASSSHIQHVGTAYTHFYGQDVEGVGADASQVTRTGEQGELAEMRIPQSRALALGVANIITGAKVAWSAIAANNDHKSKAAAVTTATALEYIWKDRGVFALGVQTVIEGVAFGESVLFTPWDTNLGEEKVALAGKVHREGDIAFHNVPTWDVVRDPTYKSWRQLPWVAVVLWENKYDVAAGVADEDTRQSVLKKTSLPAGKAWAPNQGSSLQVDPDVIPVTYWYHKRTAALPNGRWARMVEGGLLLDEGPLPQAYWKLLPVHRFDVGELVGTPFPHSSFWDALAACQVADSIHTSLATNITTTAPGLISAESDSEIAPNSLAGGPKVLYRKAGSQPPVAINLQQASPEQFKYLSLVRQEAQQMLNLNPTSFGQTEGKALSGAAFALLASMSIQNNSNLQGNWVDFVTRVGNCVLDSWRFFVSTPRKLAIAGKGRSSAVKSVEVGPGKFDGVDRVMVEIGNPLQQTAAGRLELAQLFITIPGLVRTPEQIQALVDTGRLDPMTEALSNQLLMISEENEALAEGTAVPVTLTDDHRLHLKEHPGVGASMEQRLNDKVMEALQAHIAEHIKILRETDPAILLAIGQQPLAPAGPPGMPPGPGGPPPPGAPPGPEAAEPAAPAPQDAAAGVNMPSMPTNPATGEDFQPAAGAPVQ